MPLTITYPVDKQTIYHNGVVVQPHAYKSTHIKILPNDEYLCTCGQIQQRITCFHTHRKTLKHLLASGQITEKHPTLSIQQQRQNLLNSGAKLF